VIAQVDEQHAAMIADAVNPAGKANGGADIRLAESGTGVAAVTVHRLVLELQKAAQLVKRRTAAWSKSGGKAHDAPVLSRPRRGLPARVPIQTANRRLSPPKQPAGRRKSEKGHKSLLSAANGHR
jgi:hypothetical protein